MGKRKTIFFVRRCGFIHDYRRVCSRVPERLFLFDFLNNFYHSFPLPPRPRPFDLNFIFINFCFSVFLVRFCFHSQTYQPFNPFCCVEFHLLFTIELEKRKVENGKVPRPNFFARLSFWSIKWDQAQCLKASSFFSRVRRWYLAQVLRKQIGTGCLLIRLDSGELNKFVQVHLLRYERKLL